MRTVSSPKRAQGGFALITSIVLLMIITILALGMFRGFATQEHIAGNLREKERAFHAAVSAEQYAEWWLLEPGNITQGTQACSGTMIAPGQGQICNLAPALTPGVTVADPSSWTFRVTYTPAGMTVGSGANSGNTNGDTQSSYVRAPGFWITDLGISGDGAGEAYQIDAYSYGATTNTVAVVESVYEVQQGMNNRGGF
jgi:type IV pilus assembly protein PilX